MTTRVTGRWLAAGIAVAVGVGLAVAQRTSPGAPSARTAPSVESPAPGAPSGAGADASAARPSTPPPRPANAAAAQVPATPLADGDRHVPAAVRPTALPPFFVNGLKRPAAAGVDDPDQLTPGDLQARMDEEHRDPAWASSVEWQLQNYLALQPSADVFGTPSVLCRRTVCRVLTIARRKALDEHPEADWHDMMSRLRYESVSNQFSGSAETVVLNHAHPGQVGFVTYFARAGSRHGDPVEPPGPGQPDALKARPAGRDGGR